MGNQNQPPNYNSQFQPVNHSQHDMVQHDLKYSTKNQNVMPYQTPYYQYPQMQLQKSSNLYIKNYQIPASQSLLGSQRPSLINSSTNLSTQTASHNLTNSISSSNSEKYAPLSKGQTPTISEVTNLSTQQQPMVQIKDANIIVRPLIQFSILRKQKVKKNDKKIKIDTRTVEMDELRATLRGMLKQMLTKLIPDLDSDIGKMSNAIQSQRDQKFKDRNRVLFLLKQKSHYQKLSEKLTDYCQKLKTNLLNFRKKDSLNNVTIEQFQMAKQMAQTISPFLQSIQKDLPQKGWQVLIDQPTSNIYRTVVKKAQQDLEIVAKYNQLEQSLTNPEVLQQIAQQNMRYSVTRAVGEVVDEKAKNFIQGPAFYSKQQLKDNKNPKVVI